MHPMACVLAALYAAAPATPRADLPRLVVLDLTAKGGVSQDVAASFTEAVTNAAGARGFFQVMSNRDISTLLGVERQKELLGCTDESQSCLTELTGALDARYVLSGSVSKVGDNYQLSLQTLDSRSSQALGRSLRIARSLDALRGAVPFVVSEATGTPRPPPPSKVVPISLLVAGGVFGVASGVVGFNALTREGVVQAEFDRAATGKTTLTDAAYYRQEAAAVGRDKTLSLVGLCAGAALVTAGFLLMPKDPSDAVALVPTLNGAAVVGVFP